MGGALTDAFDFPTATTIAGLGIIAFCCAPTFYMLMKYATRPEQGCLADPDRVENVAALAEWRDYIAEVCGVELTIRA